MNVAAVSKYVAPAMPATPGRVLDSVCAYEKFLLALEQVQISTEHTIHAGMYARTITMPPGTVLTGALVTLPTLLIVAGSGRVLVGDEVFEFHGYNVIPASAGRKQVFVSESEVTITMVFPTRARTVEEAEAEFTDDAARLLSRRQDANRVVITETTPAT